MRGVKGARLATPGTWDFDTPTAPHERRHGLIATKSLGGCGHVAIDLMGVTKTDHGDHVHIRIDFGLWRDQPIADNPEVITCQVCEAVVPIECFQRPMFVKVLA